MLTAIILTHNSQNSLAETIRSVKFADKIIILDDFSQDKTIAIAKKHKVTIYKHKLNNHFAKHRNFVLRKVTSQWILFIDSDEQVTKKLAAEITKTINAKESRSINGYFIRRADHFLGKKLQYGETGTHYLLRLGQNKQGLWTRPVHETWQIKGKTAKLKHELVHTPHKNIYNFIRKINLYSTINITALDSKKVTPNIVNVIIYPTAKFFLNYLIKKGYKDKEEGLIHAVMMSFHSFCTRSKHYLRLNEKNS